MEVVLLAAWATAAAQRLCSGQAGVAGAGIGLHHACTGVLLSAPSTPAWHCAPRLAGRRMGSGIA
ncbi:hypothetical protein [Xanthomonas axonopodis]|uniref:hypothetical protein n=1 Tax=Xanthomonas axonopodis TaxID=53413 RepID=UPI000A4BD906|nr:hypothetical protein [Xanthomonas axonopodis]